MFVVFYPIQIVSVLFFFFIHSNLFLCREACKLDNKDI
jgi:hypothetical protein